MKRSAVYFFVLLQLTLQACATLVQAPQYPPDPARGAPLEAYARVLARYVNERGEVDFPALARDRADLDHYIAYVARTPDHQFAIPNDRLAHYINSYNALSMYNVLEAGIPETHAGLAKVRFFYLRKLVIGNRRLSLYQYENDIIRPLGDPRAHFALNCKRAGLPHTPAHAVHGQRPRSGIGARGAQVFRRGAQSPGCAQQPCRLPERAVGFLSRGLPHRGHTELDRLCESVPA